VTASHILKTLIARHPHDKGLFEACTKARPKFKLQIYRQDKSAKVKRRVTGNHSMQLRQNRKVTQRMIRFQQEDDSSDDEEVIHVVATG
jgi:hypothetical protein